MPGDRRSADAGNVPARPDAAMAATALRMLLSGASEPHHIELATTLIVRESTAPPRA